MKSATLLSADWQPARPFSKYEAQLRRSRRRIPKAAVRL
jgi:hypothetical protein